MATNKTIPTKQSVEEFINAVEDEKKRKDSFEIVELLKQVTGFEAQMWGSSIIGFGSYHYKYETGREGDSPLIAFSPRKQNFAIYLAGLENSEELLKKLGKHSMGKVCLYIKRLSDIDVPTLKTLMENSFAITVAEHGK